jgi:hypothetical protein
MLCDKHLLILARTVGRAGRWLGRQALRPFRRRILQRILLPEPDSAHPAAPMRHLAVAALCLCLCGALLGRMIHSGIARGMDGGIYEVVEDAAHAMAVAISDMRFHLNRGYVGYSAVSTKLEEGGFTVNTDLLKALGRANPEQLKDRALLNQAILSALNAQIPKDVGFGDRSLLSMRYAELGLVDYFKLAFRLFGYRVESAFYLYFTLLGLSAATFVTAYWRSPIILTVPILFLAAGNIIFATSFFDSINSQSVANPRFVSTLGILPGLHILMLMLGARRATVIQVTLACVQAFIFEFALSIRAALFWCVIFVVFIALIQVAILIARTGAGRSLRASFAEWSAELAAIRLWPALVLLIGVWTYQSAISMKMHPSYELEDFLPEHMRYHNAFMGLTAHPDWYPRFGNKYYYGTQSDTFGFLVGALYLLDHYDVPESYYISPLYGGPKVRLDDRMVKKAYMQFIMENPRFTIEAHFYKMRLIANVVERLIRSARPKSAAVLIAFSSITFAALFWAASQPGTSTRRTRDIDVLRLTIVGTCAALFSFMPNIYAIFGDTVMGDGLWMTLFAMLAIGCGALVAVASVSLALLRKRAHGHVSGAERDPPAVASVGMREPTTYVRLLGALLLSAAVAWSAVTYFNHGKLKPNATPALAPAFFHLTPPPSPVTAPH